MQTGIDRVYDGRKRLIQKMKAERIDLLLCPSFVSCVFAVCSQTICGTYDSVPCTLFSLISSHLLLLTFLCFGKKVFRSRSKEHHVKIKIVIFATPSSSCPFQICPAVPHWLPNQIPHTAMMSTLFWNAMDFPAGVVTVSSMVGIHVLRRVGIAGKCRRYRLSPKPSMHPYMIVAVRLQLTRFLLYPYPTCVRINISIIINRFGIAG